MKGTRWPSTRSPTCPTTTGHWPRTSRARSWNCTTPSTTRPTSAPSTRPSTSSPKPATRATSRAIVGLEKTLAFNLGGHVNHSTFWQNLSPDGGDKPTGELGAAIDDAFGSFDGFQAHFTAAATTIQGSGWAILGWDQLGKRLLIHQLYDQQANLPAGQVPLVMLDMWEHAFYLQYKNVKPDYVKAWWNVTNWADAQARFTAARA